MEVGERSAVFEEYASRYWGEWIGQWQIFPRKALESANLANYPSGTGRKKAWKEVYDAVPLKLGNGTCFGGDLTGNFCRRDASADQKDVLTEGNI